MRYCTRCSLADITQAGVPDDQQRPTLVLHTANKCNASQCSFHLYPSESMPYCLLPNPPTFQQSVKHEFQLFHRVDTNSRIYSKKEKDILVERLTKRKDDPAYEISIKSSRVAVHIYC